MKQLSTLFLLLLSFSSLSAQTTLFSEDFNSGTPGGFTLNTSDVSSMASPASYNFWLVNNAYTGGSGSLMCLGFPFTYTIANTPAQPSGITGFPNSNYLHTLSDEGSADGIFCSSFAAADGICFLDENIFTRMSTDVSTVGYTGTTLSFWWTCGGGTNIYGELYYSTNAGSTWNLISTPVSQYKSQLTWTQTTVSLPAFDGQSTLRFGFRFFNASSTSAVDPGMSIDDFKITSTLFVAPTITTGALAPLEYCTGTTITVDYTATGTFTGANVFSCELSDGSGSFASPTIMGGIASTALSGSFGATFPVGTPDGTGYRIRVTSNSPAVAGTDNGANITLWQQPVISGPSPLTSTICEGYSTSLTATTTAGTMAWQESADGINFSNTGVTGGTYNTPAVTADMWYRTFALNGTCDTVFSDTAFVTVVAPPVITGPPALTDSICIYTSVSIPASTTTGTLQWQMSSDGINWVGTGVSGSPFISPPLVANTWFRAYVANGICDTVFSDTVVAGIAASPSAFFTWSSSGTDAFFTDGSSGAVVWNWDFGDGGTSSAASPTHTYSSLGTYPVTLIVVNAAGCTDTFTDAVDIILGRMNALGEHPVTLFPNPFDESVTMEARMKPHSLCIISIYTPDGRRVSQSCEYADASGRMRFVWKPGAEIPAGIYLIRISSGGEDVFARAVKL